MYATKAQYFRALAVESRIRIIELLKQKGALCVSDLSQALGISPSAVSQHLKVLKYAGLVRSERKGYYIPYQVEAAALERCGELLSELCTCGCEGSGSVREAEISGPEDKLTLLRQYERELEEELMQVRGQIGEIEREE
jgi:DNA-binding transcriptional ArsR family regulator